MAVVKRVGVLSIGKVLGILYALIGLVFGLFVSLWALTGAMDGGSQQGVSAMMFGAAAVIILPIFYGLAGFVGGIIVGALYNLTASFAGGIELDLEMAPVARAFPVAEGR